MALKDKILDKAQKYMLKGYLDKALAEYKSAVDVDPRDISIKLRIGDLYVKTNRMDEAIKEYTDVARANAQRGFYPKAIAVYKKVLKLDDSILDIHYKLAELYTKQRLIADAISSYSYIVSIFEKKGKTSEVMELLKKMLDIDPDNVGIRLKLADLFSKLSFEKDAVAEYALIFEKLMVEGKVDRAEKVFLSLYGSRPNEPVILNALAEIYRNKGDDVKYLNYARPLLKAHTKNEDIASAKALCQSMLSVRPDDPDALEVMRGIEPPELVPGKEAPQEASAAEFPAEDFPDTAEPAGEEPSWEEHAGSKEAAGEPGGEDEKAQDDSLITWPEDDIEISLEGFEREQALSGEPAEAAGDAFTEEEEFDVAGPGPELEPAVIEEAGGAAEDASRIDAAPAGHVIEAAPEHEPPAVEAASPEVEEEVEIDIDLGDYGVEPSFESAPAEEAVEVEEYQAVEETPVEESEESEAREPAEEPVVEEDVLVEVLAEEAVEVEEEQAAEETPVEEPEEAEAPEPAEEPVAEEEIPVEVTAEEAVEVEEEQAAEETPVEEPEEAEVPEPAEVPVVEEDVPAEVSAEEAFEIEEEQAAEETPVEEPEEAEVPEPAEVPVVEEEVPVEVSAEEAFEVEEEQAAEEAPVEEPEESEVPEPVEEPVAEEEVPVEVLAEEAFEVEEEQAAEEAPVEDIEEPVAEEDVPVEATAEEAFEIEEAQAVKEAPVEDIGEAEAPESAEEPVVEEQVPLEVSAEEAVEIEEEQMAAEESSVEDPFDLIEPEAAESIEDAVERLFGDEPFIVDVEDASAHGTEAASSPDAPVDIEEIEPAAETPAPAADTDARERLEFEEMEDELSSAIEELQARMDSDDMLLEPETVKIDESAPESEFIDLSAELGMEEALEGLAGTWSQNEGESTDAFDEFKDGIGQQLSREDTETHYNLGIAYMEMELFDEAAKEFKIALKEPRLEGDCYARLGLCAMAESKPDEAVMHYLKGLKVEGRSEDERKGMMYELALAYEAAGDIDEAFQLFTSIHDLDPDYREVGEKLSGFDRESSYIPADDGLIEVELL